MKKLICDQVEECLNSMCIHYNPHEEIKYYDSCCPDCSQPFECKVGYVCQCVEAKE